MPDAEEELGQVIARRRVRRLGRPGRAGAEREDEDYRPGDFDGSLI